ncbi:MAG: helix-turn-helix transcriptional regulator [Clostridiales bacterium]|nr:helix-turn-helix transcriptional regulator [Clostridiales bacterium]
MTKFKFHQDNLYFFRLNLAYYRHRKGYTQEQLAEKVGISVGYLASLESRRSDAEPSYELLSDLAYELGISVSMLTAVDEGVIE